MTQAALFYENASLNLGVDFLDDVYAVIDLIRIHPELGQSVGGKLDGQSCIVFHSTSFTS